MEERRKAGLHRWLRRSQPRRAKPDCLAGCFSFEKAAFILSALVLVGAALSWAFPERRCNALPFVSAPTVTVTVQPGDTLWGIARRSCGNGVDIRKTVYKITQLNDLNDVLIRPGQAIVVPVERHEMAGRD